MSYGMIRMLIIGVLYLPILIFIIYRHKKRKVPVKKKERLVLISIPLVMGTILSGIPFERHLIAFETPVAAYHYSSPGKDIALEYYYNNNAYIVAVNRSKFDMEILTQNERGWVFPRPYLPFSERTPKFYLVNGYAVYAMTDEESNTTQIVVTRVGLSGETERVADDFEEVSCAQYDIYYVENPSPNPDYSSKYYCTAIDNGVEVEFLIGGEAVTFINNTLHQ